MPPAGIIRYFTQHEPVERKPLPGGKQSFQPAPQTHLSYPGRLRKPPHDALPPGQHKDAGPCPDPRRGPDGDPGMIGRTAVPGGTPPVPRPSATQARCAQLQYCDYDADRPNGSLAG
jgi:hypothetical protein